MSNVVDIASKKLRAKFPSLTMDEGRIIVHAYMIRDGKSTTITGNSRTPPDGYLDSLMGLDFLDSSSSMPRYCRSLVSEDYLCKHPTEVDMVRISDRMIPMCEEIIKGL